MRRTILLVGLTVLSAGCAATVTKSRMPFGEVNIENMECRRSPQPGSVIPKTICASADLWASWDAREADKSARFIDLARDSNDNRVLYRDSR
jgi:hypothetical protein